MLTVAGRPHQRRELWIMDDAEPQGAEGTACKFSMFANDTFDELATVIYIHTYRPLFRSLP